MCDGSLRALRSEFGLTQDEMSHELGISKKTLVGIEKGRSSLGWTGSVAVCLLFSDSDTLRSGLGCDPLSAAAGLRDFSPAVRGISHSQASAERIDEPSGSPLWRRVAEFGDLFAEQNVISEHYRLIDAHGNRVFASFDYREVESAAARLAAQHQKKGGKTE